MFDKFLCKRFHEKNITVDMILRRLGEHQIELWSILTLCFGLLCYHQGFFSTIKGVVAITLFDVAVIVVCKLLGVYNYIIATCPLSKKPEQ